MNSEERDGVSPPGVGEKKAADAAARPRRIAAAPNSTSVDQPSLIDLHHPPEEKKEAGDGFYQDLASPWGSGGRLPFHLSALFSPTTI